MIISSAGSIPEMSGRLPMVPQSTEIIPTRPRNIAEAITIFEISLSCGVMPSDIPVVVIAEKTSNITAFMGSSGCSTIIIMEYDVIAKIDRHMTAFARRTDVGAIVRLYAVTPFCPNAIERRFSITAANALIFMPPPIDCEAHPTHIMNMAIRSVAPSHSPGPYVVKPAVRTVVEQNMACAIRFHVGRPVKQWLYSRI